MAEIKVKEIMSKDVVFIKHGTPVKEVAKIFLEKKIGGAPVADEKGELVGIVTENDLIMQDVRLRFPSYIHLLDGVIFLESVKKYDEELRKAIGATVDDVMTREVITVAEEATIEDAATIMTEKKISRLPVLREGKVVGMVAKRDIIKALSRS